MTIDPIFTLEPSMSRLIPVFRSVHLSEKVAKSEKCSLPDCSSFTHYSEGIIPRADTLNACYAGWKVTCVLS